MKKLRSLVTGLALFAAGMTAMAHEEAYYVHHPAEGWNGVDDCIGNYFAYTIVTNSWPGAPSELWMKCSRDGWLYARVSGFLNAKVKALRSDGVKHCDNSWFVQFYARSNRSYRFLVYFTTPPPTNYSSQLFVIWPDPEQLKIISGPTLQDSSNPSQIGLEIDTGDSTNLLQLFYSQTLDPTNGWIAHPPIFQGGSGIFTTNLVAHNTTNRPYGFWKIGPSTGTFSPNWNQEDVDSPIGFPAIIGCTNCPNDPTPPMP